MSFQAEAMVIAGTIYAKPRTTMEQHESALYATVDSLLELSDVAKADLYARLAERLTADTTFTEAETIIARALIENRKVYPHG